MKQTDFVPGGWKDRLWSVMEEDVFDVASSDELFNQYAAEDRQYDRAGSTQIRRSNLRSYIWSFRKKPSVLLIAEAPGPWGCRFSGVPITSEQQLLDPDFPIHGLQSSLAADPHTEYSANIFWRTLRDHHSRFFVWNSVPFHPRKPGAPTSIRTPRTSELYEFAPVITEIHEILKPSIIVAIGRKAEKTLASIGLPCRYVRHPSQGGAVYFARGISNIFNSDESGIE